MRLKHPVPALVLGAALLTASGTIMIGSADADFPDPFGRPDLDVLKEMIESGQAADARTDLLIALETTPGDADVLNLLGYAGRKLGDYDPSRDDYVRALTINPRHKGALEYFGELELQTGNLDATRTLLARLEGICPDGRDELDDLLDAFAERDLLP
ncbi:MAG: tetratricopeptide repeat protein [Pseudomonadota bacterium]